MGGKIPKLLLNNENPLCNSGLIESGMYICLDGMLCCGCGSGGSGAGGGGGGGYCGCGGGTGASIFSGFGIGGLISGGGAGFDGGICTFDVSLKL